MQAEGNSMRYGRFSATFEVTNHLTEPFCKMMADAGIIILREQIRRDSGLVEYTAHSGLFDQLMPGEEIPEYRIIMNQKNQETAIVEATRVDPDRPIPAWIHELFDRPIKFVV